MSKRSLHKKVSHGHAAAHPSYSLEFACIYPPAVPAAGAKVFFNGQHFCSLAEAACGVLLERLVEGFTLVNGRTFQIPIGAGCSADFRIQNVIVEYHHLRFYTDGRRFGDFSCEAEYREYRRKFRRARNDHQQRVKVVAETRAKLQENYYLRRRRLLDRDPGSMNCELIVASTIEELYHCVIRRFSVDYPPLPAFEECYHRLVREIAQASSSQPRFERKAA